MLSPTPRSETRFALTDFALAVVIAAVMTAAWTVAAWPDLSRLILPTADDAVRLAQVRDWLAGQAFSDWTQYRLAPPTGADMHWSRLADLGPAAIITMLKPALGQARAELVAAILWPALLFVAMICLNIAMARRLWGAQGGVVAALLTALAYPGTTLFAPGRLDHHGLQAVGIGLAVLALMQPVGWRWGMVAGAAMAFSLMIGLETVPQTVMLLGCATLFWIVGGGAERGRIAAVAAGLAGTTLIFVIALRPGYWPAELCDAFTPASTSAILWAAAALGGMAALAGRLPDDWRWRMGVAVALGLVALVATLTLYPGCRSFPYGAVDPFLRTHFIGYIDEAGSILRETSPARILSLIGPVLAALTVGALMLVRGRAEWRIITPLLLVIAMSTAVMFVQLRGIYIGAPLVPPMLAGLVIAARGLRRWHLPALAGAWIASAGIAYLELPRLIDRALPRAAQSEPSAPARIECQSEPVWDELNAHPTGTVMAPINLAAYFLGMTRHSVVGAGYHRNNRGTLAMYRYFLSPPDRAAAIARQWDVTYVAFCPGDFTEGDMVHRYPNSVAAMLHRGQTPPGLTPIPLRDGHIRFYRVLP